MKNVIITILVMLVLGLGGFIIYDKILKDDNTSKIKESNTTKDVESEKEIKNEEVKQEIIDTDLVYENYIKNLIDNRNNSKSDSFKYEVNSDGNPDAYSYTFSVENNGNLLFNLAESDIYNDYKISDKVLSAFIVNIGQSTYHNLYFLKEDGYLYELQIDTFIQTGKLNISKINKKNIINVVSGPISNDGYSSAIEPIFIDIDGNISYKE